MEQDQPLLTHHGKAQCIIHEPIQFTLTLESRHGVNLVHHLNATAVHSPHGLNLVYHHLTTPLQFTLTHGVNLGHHLTTPLGLPVSF